MVFDALPRASPRKLMQNPFLCYLASLLGSNGRKCTRLILATCLGQLCLASCFDVPRGERQTGTALRTHRESVGDAGVYDAA